MRKDPHTSPHGAGATRIYALAGIVIVAIILVVYNWILPAIWSVAEGLASFAWSSWVNLILVVVLARLLLVLFLGDPSGGKARSE